MINFIKNMNFNSKPVLKELNNVKIVKNLKAVAKNDVKVSLNTELLSDYSLNTTFVTNISQDKRYIGRDIYTTYTDNHIEEDLISISKLGNRQRQGFGEILKLTTIITMLENKMKSIDLLSLKTAVPFHHKYLFKPDFRKDSYRNEAMLRVLTSKKEPEYNSLRERAEVLLFALRTDINHTREDIIWESVSELVNDYISLTKELQKSKLNPSEKVDYSLNYDIPMNLKLEDVIENKGYFNKLFDNHRIDYQI